LDRIDKVLFILPFIPLVDAASTLFLLTFGGKESGILAEPVYERYGQFGLVALSIFAFFALFGCVWFLKYAKTRIKQGERSKPNRVALVVAVNLFFFGEAYLTGIIVQNFLFPALIAFLNTVCYPVGSDPRIFCVGHLLHENRDETAHKRIGNSYFR